MTQLNGPCLPFPNRAETESPALLSGIFLRILSRLIYNWRVVFVYLKMVILYVHRTDSASPATVQVIILVHFFPVPKKLLGASAVVGNVHGASLLMAVAWRLNPHLHCHLCVLLFACLLQIYLFVTCACFCLCAKSLFVVRAPAPKLKGSSSTRLTALQWLAD